MQMLLYSFYFRVNSKPKLKEFLILKMQFCTEHTATSVRFLTSDKYSFYLKLSHHCLNKIQRQNRNTLSVRSLVRFFCFLAKYWSYNWASLAANTCSRLKQGWWVNISPEISISNWNSPWKSPGPTKYWLVDVIFIAWKKKRVNWIYTLWQQYLSKIFFVRKWPI